VTDEEIKKITKGYFSKEELSCKCGYHNKDDDCEMNAEFLKKLLQLRILLDAPIYINSGYRCKKHLKYSKNHDGWAVDIGCKDSIYRFALIEAALKCNFTRIGIDKEFIHLDCNPEYNGTYLEKVIWPY